MTASTSHNDGLIASILGSLTVSRTFAIALGLTLIYRLGIIIYRLTLHPLAKYPGPKFAAASRLWHTYTVLSGRYLFKVHDLHEKYGPIVRLQPNELSFITSQAWDDIYGFRNGKPEMAKDTPFYTSPANFENIITASRENHGLYRRLMSRGFSDAALREQESMIQKNVNLLIQQLHSRASRGEVVDISKWYNFLTFDIIGELTFGETFGCLQNSEFHPWVGMVFDQIKLFGLTTALGNYPAVLSLLFKLLPPSLKRRADTHKQMTLENVLRRRELESGQNDFMSGLLKSDKVSEVALMGNASTLILGGSETTATLLTAVTFYLSKHPQVLERLKEEVRTSFKSVDEITFVGVSQLKFLLAVLNEALRLFPPVPYTFARSVPLGGDYIDGTFVDQGTQVGICIYAGHRSSKNFKDPDSFIPERWLEDPAYQEDDLQAVKAFSHGPRNCIGKNLAYMEMRLVLARMIFAFDWTLKDVSDDWDKADAYITWEKPPLTVHLIPISEEEKS